MRRASVQHGVLEDNKPSHGRRAVQLVEAVAILERDLPRPIWVVGLPWNRPFADQQALQAATGESEGTMGGELRNPVVYTTQNPMTQLLGSVLVTIIPIQTRPCTEG